MSNISFTYFGRIIDMETISRTLLDAGNAWIGLGIFSIYAYIMYTLFYGMIGVFPLMISLMIYLATIYTTTRLSDITGDILFNRGSILLAIGAIILLAYMPVGMFLIFLYGLILPVGLMPFNIIEEVHRIIFGSVKLVFFASSFGLFFNFIGYALLLVAFYKLSSENKEQYLLIGVITLLIIGILGSFFIGLGLRNLGNRIIRYASDESLENEVKIAVIKAYEEGKNLNLMELSKRKKVSYLFVKTIVHRMISKEEVKGKIDKQVFKPAR